MPNELMPGSRASILEAIGGTPILRLQRLGQDLPAEIYVKCEFLNPAGSMKDRMALQLVNAAEQRGQLKAGGTIVEATSGNTGAALAMIAAVRGYRCIFVMPDKMSSEKIASLRAFGARVVVCPTAVEPDDPRSYYSVAARLAAETPNSFLANQYHNPDNPLGHFLSTGPEIWQQTGGAFDVLVAGMGTGGTLSGTGRFLKQHMPALRIVGVDPVGSLYYDYVKSGRLTKPFGYKVEGIGEDFLPSTMDLSLLDDVVRVDDRECFLTTRDLVRLEGLYVGGSSGAAVAGALKLARHPGASSNAAAHRPLRLLVILPDGAAKYLSKIFNDDWMREHSFLAEETGLGRVDDLLRSKSAPEVIVAQADDRVREVVKRLKQHGISQLPVLRQGKLIGAISEVELLRTLVHGEVGLDSPVGPLVESDYATVTRDTKIELLQSTLGDASMVLVADADGGLQGVITKIDLIDYLAKRLPG